MKILFVVISLLLTGCANFSNTAALVNYDNTNPVKVEQATQGLKIENVLPSSNKVDGTIAVRTIELTALIEHLDADVVYMIEDNLISNLLENNYRVVERDPQALEHMYKESSSKYQTAGSSGSGSESLIETLNLNDLTPGDSSDCCGAPEGVWDYLVDDHKASQSDGGELTSTGLNAADYILSYRVLECGVVYNDYKGDTDTTTPTTGFGQAADVMTAKVERSARTRLHVRLTNSKTSEIIAAGMVENEVVDVISKAEIGPLSKISYKYYHHTLPLQNGTKKSSGLSLESLTKPSLNISQNESPVPAAMPATGGSKKYLYAAGGVLLLLMMLGGD